MLINSLNKGLLQQTIEAGSIPVYRSISTILGKVIPLFKRLVSAKNFSSTVEHLTVNQKVRFKSVFYANLLLRTKTPVGIQ